MNTSLNCIAVEHKRSACGRWQHPDGSARQRAASLQPRLLHIPARSRVEPICTQSRRANVGRRSSVRKGVEANPGPSRSRSCGSEDKPTRGPDSLGAATRVMDAVQPQQLQEQPRTMLGLPLSDLDYRILSMAVPAVAALAADPLLSLIDTAFVGHLGPNALAALGVNTGLFSFAFVVFNFLATATTPLLAACLASGDREQAGRLTVQASALSVLLGVAVTTGLLLGAEPLLAFLGAGPETGEMHDLALTYLRFRAVAAPAVLLMTVGQGVFRSLADMRTPLAITLGANLVNLTLDCSLIWGLGWGVAGAAAATSVAEWGAAAAYAALVWQRREDLGLSPLPSWLDLESVTSRAAPFARAGGAVLARTVLLLGTKTMAAATATRLGPVPIAAHQVLAQLWLLSSLVVDSLAVSGQTLVAVSLAEGDRRAARRTSDRLLQFGGGLGLALVALYSAGGPLLTSLFTDDAQVSEAVQSLLPLTVGMVPVCSLVYVLDGVLVGASDFKFLAGAMVLSAAVTAGVLLEVEPWGLGLEGVWAALGGLMTLRLATLMWRYQSPHGPVPPPPPPPTPPVVTAAADAAAPGDGDGPSSRACEALGPVGATAVVAAACLPCGGAGPRPEASHLVAAPPKLRGQGSRRRRSGGSSGGAGCGGHSSRLRDIGGSAAAGNGGNGSTLRTAQQAAVSALTRRSASRTRSSRQSAGTARN